MYFYNSSNWTSIPSGWGTDPSICNWTGITCFNNSVTELRLSGRLGSGVIPTNFSKLSNLVILDLSSNNLGGAIPTALGNLKNLKILDLRSNMLSDGFPDVFTGLRYLDISDNQLFGTFQVSSMDLTYLDISLNIIDTLSDSLGTLSSLKFVDVSHNNLTALPDSAGSLLVMETFNVSHNRIDALNDGLASLINLKTLIFDRNHIVTMPDGYNNLNVTHMSGSNNRITSLNPNLVSFYRNMQYLDLSGNDISSIPVELQFPMIKHLDLSYNPIDYMFPTSFYSLTNVEILDLSNTHLNGVISPLDNLTRLVELRLSSNSITNLPIVNSTNLKVLLLAYNSITTSLPNVYFPHNLDHIDLSGNYFQSVIPMSFIGSAVKIEMFNCGLMGIIPNFFYSSVYVNVSHNNFIGGISELLNNSDTLQVLSAADNQLSSLNINRIPPSLSYLDLSHNKINGTLPAVLNSTLSTLYIDGNYIQCPSSYISVTGDCRVSFSCGQFCDTTPWTKVTACINPCENRLPPTNTVPTSIIVPTSIPTTQNPSPVPTPTQTPTPTPTPTPIPTTIVVNNSSLNSTNYTINSTNNYVFPDGVVLQNSTIVISTPSIIFNNTVLLNNNSSLLLDYGTQITINGDLIALTNSQINLNINSTNNQSFINGDLQLGDTSKFIIKVSDTLSNSNNALLVVNGSVTLNGNVDVFLNQRSGAIEILRSNQQLDQNITSNIHIISTSQGDECSSRPTLYTRQQSLFVSFETNTSCGGSSLTNDQLMGIYIGVPIVGVLAITICLVSLIPRIRRKIAPYSMRRAEA
eukprot:TRINITY_DN1898_c0_g2_i7.p1 TRINITY_DN1898_c0_g2~~TRINITY_DN1898_c0_g2_i7.p1  ORF type:complete len:803 (-),score=116.64 TRINITY_DN1898_c0_g2_i7:924-3332(-)